MEIAMQLSYSGSVVSAVASIVEFEKRGLDVVWVAEAYGFDSPTTMGFLAAKTQRIKIGAGILPVYSRTPALIAQTAAGLDEVSGGRAILGLGASGPRVIEGWHGVTYDRPIARTREVIEICRLVWSRSPLVHNGIFQLPLPPDAGTGLGKPLKLLNDPVRGRIPVFVAALGEKNVEMAFEVADGWLPIFYIPEKAGEVWGNAIKRGMARRDVSLGAPAVAGGGLLAVGTGVEGLRDLGREQLALYIGGMGARGRNFYNDLVRRYGFEREAEIIQDLYLSGDKKGAEREVPHELLEATSLIGSPGYIKDRLIAYRESGVTMINVTPVGGDPIGSFERFAEIVHSLG